jgi:hypothetical protein
MSATFFLLGLLGGIFVALLALVHLLLPATLTEVVPRHEGDPDWVHSPASLVLSLVIFLARLVFWATLVLWGLAMLSLVVGSKTHPAGIIEGSALNHLQGVEGLLDLSFGPFWYAVTPGFYFLLGFLVLVLLGSLMSGESQGPGDPSGPARGRLADDDPNHDNAILGMVDPGSPFYESSSHDFPDTGDTLDMGTSIFESSLSDDAMDMHSVWDDTTINPATGLPMVSGIGGVDVAGNPYGMDSSHDDMFSSFDDSFDSGISDSFSDPFDSFDSFDSLDSFDSSLDD